jgi:hypothetical protein
MAMESGLVEFLARALAQIATQDSIAANPIFGVT